MRITRFYGEYPLMRKKLSDIAIMTADRKDHRNIGKTVTEELFYPKSYRPKEYVKEKIIAFPRHSALVIHCLGCIFQNADSVRDYLNGKDKAWISSWVNV